MTACFYLSAALLQGSVDHTTCEYQRLIDAAPDTIIPARPFTVHDRVYDAGDPLGGNFCPYNSSTPLQPCKKVPQALLNCFQKSNTSSFVNIVFILLLPCHALSPHQTLLQQSKLCKSCSPPQSWIKHLHHGHCFIYCIAVWEHALLRMTSAIRVLLGPYQNRTHSQYSNVATSQNACSETHCMHTSS